MEAPSVRYTKTSDGYSIAYMTSGEGPPLVFMPQVFQHGQRLWDGGPYARSFRHWANRFTLVQYDSRGQGLSQRDLPEGLFIDAYELDLEAVVNTIGLKTVALHAYGNFGHTAIRFAVKHPNRVSALVLHNVTLRGGIMPNLSEVDEIARSNWHYFLLLASRTMFPKVNSQALTEYFRESANQADHLKLLEAGRDSNIEALLPRLKMPVLVIAGVNDPWRPGSNDLGQQIAPLIPGARLIFRDAAYSREGDATAMAFMVDTFLDEVGSASVKPPAGLSMREVAVLRLVAAGKNNPQIADELVISLDTVQRHVSNILTKTGLANRTEAATYATRHGLV